MRAWIALAGGLAVLFGSVPAMAQPFTYQPPGDLVPGSGQGATDPTVYAPGMRFPIEVAPAYVNSQVWGHGGMNGPGGGQCDTENYSYPWWDNFCETRSWTTPMCPTGEGHQGEDIRPSTCEKDVHWVLATVDGTITSIGTYTVTLTTTTGTRHRFMHMEPSSLVVSVGDTVQRGDKLGRVSNAFDGTPTTIHLHFEIHQNVSGIGDTPVSPYMSLVASYEELLGVAAQPCAVIPPPGGILDDSGPCARLYGPAASWRVVTDAGNESNLRWTYAFDGAAPSNWAQWLAHFEEGGDYEVQVNLVAAYAQSQAVRYVVRHAGQDSELVIDQSAGEGWRSLGVFPFGEGGDQFVALHDNTGESLDAKRMIAFDAVQFIRVYPAEPSPEAGSEPEPDAPVEDASDDASEVGPDASEAGRPEAGPAAWSSDEAEGCACLTVGGTGRGGSVWWLGLAWWLMRRRSRKG